MDLTRASFCKLAAAATTATLALATPALLTGCRCSRSGSSSKQGTRDPWENIPLHDYNWSCLAHTPDGILSYNDGEGLIATRGIDVSHHEGNIDWAQVATSGIDFAIIRVGYRGYTEGTIQLDDCFLANITGALEHGIAVGAYFFSQAITTDEAIAEADFVHEMLAPYHITYPVAFDIEENNVTNERIGKLTRAEKTAHACEFCNRIASYGYTPIVYGNDTWLNGFLDLETLINKYDLWFASYNPQPQVPYLFTIWQYTNSGNLPGIEAEVDFDLCFKHYGS